MDTLVTGGAGFIGSHLVDKLLLDEHNVRVLDNFSTGSLKNLNQHKHNSKLDIVDVDVTKFNDIKDYFDGIDWVFHLAALADIVPSIVDPLNYYVTNVNGTANVVEASRKNGITRLVYAASSSCYGIPNTFPTNEKTEISLQYPYALTKYLGEETIFHWGNVYDLNVVSLRFFNVYGPRSRTTGTYGAVFGVFLAQKLANKPFTVVGDGTQTRDFIYIADVVDAIMKAVHSNINGETFNVGTGRSYSINTLVKLIEGEVEYIPRRPGEPDTTRADISKIKKYLDWNPRISFEEGVNFMLDNIEYWKDAPVWNEDSIDAATKEWFKYL